MGVSFKLSVVDLFRNKPKLTYLTLPATKVDIEVPLERAKATSEQDKRLRAVSMAVLEDYESLITEEIVKYDTKIGEMVGDLATYSVKDIQHQISSANTAVGSAIRGLSNAIDAAVKKLVDKEGKKLQLLTESRIKTVTKVGKCLISVGAAVAKLVASSGADVTSWKTLATELYALGEECYQQAKSGETLAKDLEKSLNAFIKDRDSGIEGTAKKLGIAADVIEKGDAMKTFEQVKKAAKNLLPADSNPAELAATFLKKVAGVMATSAADVEKARKKVRENTTKLLVKTDKMSGKADELTKKMKASQTLSQGVALGAIAMQAKRGASAMGAKYTERNQWLDTIQSKMQNAGMACEDKTILETIKGMSMTDCVKEGKGAFDACKEVYENIETILKAVT